MKKKKIKIAGAGLAGLTCAINLAKASFEVAVYERCSEVGKSQLENPQMLPNWFSEDDVVEELEKCNVKINWTEKIDELEVFLDSAHKILLFGKKIPIGYTVIRGGENSLERDLAKQAKSLGVKIITNFEVKEADRSFDVLATGASKVLTLGYGQVFKGNFQKAKPKVILDPELTPSFGYCYFYPQSKNLATVKISKRFDEKVDLKENLEKFKKKYLAGDIKEEDFFYDFPTKRSFATTKSATLGKSLLVGERAGFQDQLFRFGIRYAVFSGFLAAKSIIDNLNYDRLWKKQFLKEFQKIDKVRKVFQDFKVKKFNNFSEESEISIEMEKLKRFWLSKKMEFLLTLYPLCRNLILNATFSRNLLKILRT